MPNNKIVVIVSIVTIIIILFILFIKNSPDSNKPIQLVESQNKTEIKNPEVPSEKLLNIIVPISTNKITNSVINNIPSEQITINLDNINKQSLVEIKKEIPTKAETKKEILSLVETKKEISTLPIINKKEQGYIFSNIYRFEEILNIIQNIYYCRRKNKVINEYVYYKRIMNNNGLYDIIFYKLDDNNFDIPDKELLEYNDKIINIRDIDNINEEHEKYKSKILQMNIYQYNQKIYQKIISYDVVQSMIITFSNLNTSNNLTYIANKIFLNKMDIQVNAYTSEIDKNTDSYDRFIFYAKPSILDIFKEKYENQYNEKIIIIPLLNQLKIDMNNINNSMYNSTGLIETKLCIRIGQFKTSNIDELNYYNDFINQFIIDKTLYIKETEKYSSIIVEGLIWDNINSFMNIISTYQNIFHISLYLDKF